MSERSDDILLDDILDAIQQAELYVFDLEEDFFLCDRKTQDAVSRNFTIIGEAASRISTWFKESFSSVNWLELKDFRNKLVHDYFGITPAIILVIIHEDLPILKQQLLHIKQSQR